MRRYALALNSRKIKSSTYDKEKSNNTIFVVSMAWLHNHSKKSSIVSPGKTNIITKGMNFRKQIWKQSLNPLLYYFRYVVSVKILKVFCSVLHQKRKEHSEIYNMYFNQRKSIN